MCSVRLVCFIVLFESITVGSVLAILGGLAEVAKVVTFDSAATPLRTGEFGLERATVVFGPEQAFAF